MTSTRKGEKYNLGFLTNSLYFADRRGDDEKASRFVEVLYG